MPPPRRSPGSLRASLALLGTRRFGTFWVASLLSSIGTWAQQVAQPWLLLSLGSSSFIVGLDAFAMNAPVWMLTLAGGVLADRADRRRVILCFQALQMLCPVAIVVLLLANAVQPWIVVCLSVVVGVTDALSMPSFQSIVPSIVAEHEIGTAIALNATQLNLSRILGPAIAGVLMVTVGPLGCFVVSAASYVPFVLAAYLILPPRERSRPAASPADHRRLTAGLREIVRAPQLRLALLTVLVTSALCGPLITFCPVMVKDVFGADAGRFGGALAAFGIGGIVGAGLLLVLGERVERRSLASSFALLYGAVVAFAALSPWLATLVALLVVAGVAMTASNASANTILQQDAGPRLRGRTASLYMLAIRGGRSLGDVATGAAVTAIGVRSALAIDGVFAIALQLALARAWARRAAARGDGA